MGPKIQYGKILQTRGTHDQLQDLRDSLASKAGNLKVRIDADEATKDALLKELKAVTAKLEEVDRRLTKLGQARKEYTKTLQETVFALEKIESTASQMKDRFTKMNDVKSAPRVLQGTDEAKNFEKNSIWDKPVA
jgi:chromosome segregation ATPase